MDLINKYSIRTFWSDEDNSFISVCTEFPSLSAFADSRDKAIEEMETVLTDVMLILQEEGKPIPAPIESREYKGNIALRVTPFVHKRVHELAEELTKSKNQTLNFLISLGFEKYYADRTETKIMEKLEEIQVELGLLDYQMTIQTQQQQDRDTHQVDTNVVPGSFGRDQEPKALMEM